MDAKNCALMLYPPESMKGMKSPMTGTYWECCAHTTTMVFIGFLGLQMALGITNIGEKGDRGDANGLHAISPLFMAKCR